MGCIIFFLSFELWSIPMLSYHHGNTMLNMHVHHLQTCSFTNICTQYVYTHLYMIDQVEGFLGEYLKQA